VNTALANQVLELAFQIQQIPAPTFQEGERAGFVRARFQAEQLQDVTIDSLGNVFARLPGSGSGRPLVVSAHLDTVFPAGTSLRLVRRGERIYGPGIGDNSLGVAGLFGLLWAVRGNGKRLPGDLWLVANVGEEGLGDLCGMRAVVDRFQDGPLAYLVLEGMALGQVYNRGLGVRRYRISTRTAGGHSWVDYGAPSAVHELARLASRLASLALPDKPRSTLNIGVIAGGFSVNTIASQAHLELDLRSEGPQALADLTAQVERLVSAASRPGVEFTCEVIGSRPVGEISPEHPLVALALRCLKDADVPPSLNIGSTDANIPLSRGLPAVCLGLTLGDGAHTLEEYITTHWLPRGLHQLCLLVQKLFQKFPDGFPA
jgi:acetylornithine deacetylase/succinyl-diaminopimelate desuccinylase-like protein